MNVSIKKESRGIVNVGEFIYVGKATQRLFKNRLKGKRVMQRLLRQGRIERMKFRPTFIVTGVDNSQPHSHSFTIKPHNF
jgi:hypothetical protein